MRSLTCVLLIGMATSPAMAQTPAGAPAGDDPLLAVSFRPGSPSNGTSTVSPSTVPENFERADPTTQPFSLSLGTLYASGDFGTDTRTTIWSSALSARYRTGDLRLSASIPWMRIRSNSVLFTGIDSTPVLVATDAQPLRRTNSGVGDLTLGAAYTLVPAGSDVEVELSGRVKLDTATRSSRLSSGERDYALGVQVTKTYGRVAPFVSATYRILGDTAAYRLDDGLAASAGASMMVGRETYLLASYHYAASATRLVDDAHEVFAGISGRLGNSPLRVTGFATAGLSNGAPGTSAGVSLSSSF